MALDPEFLKELAQATEDLVNTNNKYILDRIAKRLWALFAAEGEIDFISSSLNDRAKLKSAEMLEEEIRKELLKRMPGMEKELKDAYKEAVKKVAKETNKLTQMVLDSNGNLKKIKMPSLDLDDLAEVTPKNLKLTKKEVEAIERSYKRTKKEIMNLTETMPSQGYNSYIKACDSAYYAVKSGISKDAAVSDAIDNLVKEGVTCIEYNSGRVDRVEVAVGRAVRTGINQMAGDVTLTRCAEMGVDHVLVSQHYGARMTKKQDFTNHAYWQGKIYHLDWNKPELKGYNEILIDPGDDMAQMLNDIKKEMGKTKSDYPDFIETCGYKKITGICGINCRHTFTPFIDGINTNTTPPISEEQNKKRWQQEIKQREMERDIIQDKLMLEEQKQLEQTAEIIDKQRELKNGILDKMEVYNNFCKENKLPNHTNRMRIRTAPTKTPQATEKEIIKESKEAVNQAGKFTPKKLKNRYDKWEAAADERGLKYPKDEIERQAIIAEAVKAKKTVYEETLRKAYEDVIQDPNFYDVCIHATPYWFEYEKKYKIDARTMAQILLMREDYNKLDNVKIRLIACSSGNIEKYDNCIAKQLSDLLEVDVMAPTNTIYVGRELRIKNGHWQIFEHKNK